MTCVCPFSLERACGGLSSFSATRTRFEIDFAMRLQRTVKERGLRTTIFTTRFPIEKNYEQTSGNIAFDELHQNAFLTLPYIM